MAQSSRSYVDHRLYALVRTWLAYAITRSRPFWDRTEPIAELEASLKRMNGLVLSGYAIIGGCVSASRREVNAVSHSGVQS